MEFELTARTVISRLFSQNCYLIHASSSKECLVVDPGIDFEEILRQITDQRLTPRAILNTHGHADHIAGNEALKRCYPDCPLVIGWGDERKLSDPELNLSARFGFDLLSPPADLVVREGDRIKFAGLELDVLETPGHCVGHVVFVCKDAKPWTVIGGDVLFREGVGRSDFPDGDWNDLVASIHNKLFTLPDDTIVLPGHGPITTIGHEKKRNPFVGEAALKR